MSYASRHRDDPEALPDEVVGDVDERRARQGVDAFEARLEGATAPPLVGDPLLGRLVGRGGRRQLATDGPPSSLRARRRARLLVRELGMPNRIGVS